MNTLKNKRGPLRRFFQAALALVCVFALTVPAPAVPAARAVTQADIDALKSDASSLASKRKDLQSKISALKSDKSKALEQKNLLDEEINNLEQQISNIQSQIDSYTQLISQTETELAETQEKEEAQYELFCKRVRAMEERGTISYWSVLFRSQDFTDLLSRLDFINEIMDSDQRVIDQLKALQEEMAAKQQQLEDQKSDAETAKGELVSKKSELNTQRTEANNLVKEIEANQKEYQSAIDAVEAEEAAVQKKIVEQSKKLAEEQAAKAAQSGGSNTTTSAALGGYIWPVPSHKINSPFGTRPSVLGSTNHKGIDIGGVGYTTPVKAAKAGTVIVSQKGSSYGNYVVVSHGSGNTTLYAHLSSRSVSVGQYVNQGDVLGITGSTGNSTGPHLHFEITENGVRIDPLKYLTNYIKNWS